MIKAYMDKNWKWMFIVYIIILVVLSLGLSFIMKGGNNWERGVYWTSPVNEGIYNTNITMTGRIYCKDKIESAELIFNNDKVLSIERTIIENKLIGTEEICFFMNDVVIDEGTNNVKVKIVTEKNEYLFHTLIITAMQEYKNSTFEFFSKAHIYAMISCFIIFLMLQGIYRLKPTDNMKTILYILIIVFVLCGDLINRIILFYDGGYNIATNLPLHMCDLSAIALFALFFMKNEKLRHTIYYMLFLWGIGGGFMALLTPDLIGYGFPTYTFFNFFFRHGGIVIGVLLVTFFEGYRPTVKGLPMVAIISTTLVLVVYCIDWLVRIFPPYDIGNYMFLMYPPLGGSAINLLERIFGSSPYYIFGLAILAVVIYFLLWIPFGIEGLMKRQKNEKEI